MSETLTNKQQSPATIRALGGVLIFIGLLLMGSMGAIIIWMNNIIANNGRAGATQSFNGTPEQAKMSFLILGAVAAFGFSAAITGSWQLLTGKRSKMLIWIMLGLWVALMIMAWVVQMTF